MLIHAMSNLIIKHSTSYTWMFVHLFMMQASCAIDIADLHRNSDNVHLHASAQCIRYEDNR